MTSYKELSKDELNVLEIEVNEIESLCFTFINKFLITGNRYDDIAFYNDVDNLIKTNEDKDVNTVLEDVKKKTEEKIRNNEEENELKYDILEKFCNSYREFRSFSDSISKKNKARYEEL